jgi:hypothetical protein
MDLYDEAMNRLEENQGNIFRSLDPGTYYIRCEHSSDLYPVVQDYWIGLNGAVPYPDEFEDDNTSATATLIAVTDGMHGHNLLPEGDEDWIRFTIPLPGHLHGTPLASGLT